MMRLLTVIAKLLTAGLLTALPGASIAQQGYPNKSIRIIVPFPPGGSIDALARLVGQKLNESWGQPVIVDNRPGGNTIIGTEALYKSPPDGYTIMLATATHVVMPLLTRTSFDPIKDFAPVATLASTEQLLVVNPLVPAKNLQELIALAKSKPGQLNYSSAGSGTSGHLAGELLSIMAGIKMQHIPYKGGAQAITDVIGGQVQLTVLPPVVVVPHIKAGKLKAIAISGEARSSALPQVPTFTEGGLPGYDVKLWTGSLVRAGTPRGIIDKLATEIARSLTMPEVRESLISQGNEPMILTPDQFAALLKADMARFAKIIKAANIRLDQ